MLFALLYLGFIALDILLSQNFMVLGMMPMGYFMAGTGYVLVVYILSTHYARLKQGPGIGVMRLFLTMLALSSTVNLYSCLKKLFKLELMNYQQLIKTLEVSDYLKIALLLVIALCIVVRRKQWWVRPWIRWLLYSSVTGIVVTAYSYMFTMSRIVYQYYGVANLFEVFGWLMVGIELMKEEVDAFELV